MCARRYLAILLALLVAAMPPVQAAQTGTVRPGTVRMGQISLSFYAVTGGSGP